MRTMPVLAKQVATLDQLSGGRVILGVGTGAYREEYEALFPDARDARRGDIVDEGMQALRLLFTERRASFRGRHVHFEDVECFPKPRQTPLPMYAGGNHPEVRRRAGQYARGLDAGGALPGGDRAGGGGHPPRRGHGRPGRRRHRHRAAVRVLDRAHARGGGPALPRLAALQAPGVAQALDAARAAGGRLRAAQPHRQPRGDLRAHPRLRAGRRHHLLRACCSSPTRCPRCRRPSSCSAATFCPISGGSMDSTTRRA